MTGESAMDATAILDYFAPLKTWLDEQNRRAKPGWSTEAKRTTYAASIVLLLAARFYFPAAVPIARDRVASGSGVCGAGHPQRRRHAARQRPDGQPGVDDAGGAQVPDQPRRRPADQPRHRKFFERNTDYMGGCAFVDVELAGAGADVFPARRHPQHLSVYDGLLDVKGRGVSARMLAWHART